MEQNYPVFVAKCDSYDEERLYHIFKESFDALGITDDCIRGKNVMLKPNLVLAKKPEFAATTHPSFVKAAARVMHEMGAREIMLAESSGGQYNAITLGNVYRTCEIAPLASDILQINNDFSFVDAQANGKALKSFHVITPFAKADVIVDLCKIKSHTLTGFSCATKNLFGLIPGIEKFEMHSNFPKIEDFSEMLVDLSAYVMREKTFIAICDGILGMEGNGPSHGTPKKADTVLVSRQTYALDVIAEHLIGFDGVTVHLDKAAERGLVDRDWRNIPVLGETDYPLIPFAKPEAGAGSLLNHLSTFMGGSFARFFETKPLITDKCVGCGRCAESCPRHTITIEMRGKKKKAVIHRENCIRCYCCQELCPIGAVGIKQNPIIKWIH